MTFLTTPPHGQLIDHAALSGFAWAGGNFSGIMGTNFPSKLRNLASGFFERTPFPCMTNMHELITARKSLATIIATRKDGEKYLPIFRRIEREIESRQTASSELDRIRAIAAA